MEVLIWFIWVLILNLALSFGIARWAKTWGRGFSAFFWLSFFLGPAIAFIVLMIKGKKQA